MSGILRIAVVVLLLNSLLSTKTIAQTPVGWRTDGTGRYPDATPPVEWSAEKNVLWKTKMPGRSFGSPIVIGQRIFVVSDPAELLCVDAKDGKILWQRSISVADMLGEEKAEQIAKAWKSVNDKRRDLQREYGELRKKQPDAKDKLRKIRDRIEIMEMEIRNMRVQNPVPAQGGAGNSAGTPVSDGKWVYATFGNGIVAAFDLAGNRRWIRFVEGADINFGHASSPVLIDGKLVVHYHDLVALDAGSGKVVWRTKADARHASPIATQVGKEPVLVIPAGDIVRVRDGKILATHRDLRVSECTPIIDKGIVYAQSGQTSAFPLAKAINESANLEPLWQVRTASGRRTPSPVLHNGLLYGVTTNGIMDVLDVKTGEKVYTRRLNLGNVYSSPTIAGNRLYISGTRGDTVVLELGRPFRLVAENELESFGSNPVFVGTRMYIRGRNHLYCIGK